MTALPILLGADNPILRAKTREIPRVTKDILSLLKNMQDTVSKAEGLGIAAPQIGQSVRVCLALIGGKMTPLINPHVTWRSDETEVAEEGCLSLPGKWYDVPRSTGIVVTYLNAKGQEQERKLQGMDARVVQHETDHLDGVLITDYQKTKKAAIEG